MLLLGGRGEGLDQLDRARGRAVAVLPTATRLRAVPPAADTPTGAGASGRRAGGRSGDERCRGRRSRRDTQGRETAPARSVGGCLAHGSPAGRSTTGRQAGSGAPVGVRLPGHVPGAPLRFRSWSSGWCGSERGPRAVVRLVDRDEAGAFRAGGCVRGPALHRGMHDSGPGRSWVFNGVIAKCRYDSHASRVPRHRTDAFRRSTGSGQAEVRQRTSVPPSTSATARLGPSPHCTGPGTRRVRRRHHPGSVKRAGPLQRTSRGPRTGASKGSSTVNQTAPATRALSRGTEVVTNCAVRDPSRASMLSPARVTLC